MVSMTGQASRDIDANVAIVWAEGIKLKWLQGWDNILVQDPPRPGGDFWLVDEGIRVRCNWTKVETHHALEWVGDNGASGRLRFQEAGDSTKVSYQAVYIAPTSADRLIAGFLKVVARNNLQQQSDKGAANELNNLSARVARKISGNPVDDNAGRQMIQLCEFGLGSNDPDVVPLFDITGRLVLADDEQIVCATEAATVAAEAAKAASGAEQWKSMWQWPATVQLTLTTQRMVYVISNFTRADGSLILIGGFTGAALVGPNAHRARAQRNGEALAGQIKHIHLLNLITGGTSRPTFSSPATITATVLQLPDRVLRVSLAVASGPEAALEVARLWTKTACGDRLERFAQLENSQNDKWTELQQQFEAPSPQTHHYGDLWGIPLGCALTRTHPYGLPEHSAGR